MSDKNSSIYSLFKLRTHILPCTLFLRSHYKIDTYINLLHKQIQTYTYILKDTHHKHSYRHTYIYTDTQTYTEKYRDTHTYINTNT